jgi:hypothetical protein
MKRIAIFGLAICFFLLLGTFVASEVKLTSDQGDKSGKWADLGKGVSYQRLSSEGEWPEVTVLRLSNTAYEEFRKNPAKFVNNYTGKFFPKLVNEPSAAGVALAAPQEPNGFWYILLPHGHPSTMYFAAVPEPVEGLDQSQKP